ncbi:1-deoxy-D-xylulose-5-phosphate synthase [Enterorhabdus sp. P55]|uniref:1-deoxy-D-xylulose-5-phosphate synthase n=1 Tax=Enterorhabdus sp. P55 TaxID=2304571 RepID=UPI00136C6A36|nr:1-deoxy-D-xylulose-5-phosphate synthase [Enterorhabdus sp. P55]MCI8451230.1 1-deoxy-D-xylulose-5-phosphate synthase [Eggerthellaceae bacterium]NBI32687.1 1-deoxy-D-xylulose-5-phosphate synthase [Enterorhabdus sp. P55]
MDEARILDVVRSPADLKVLTEEELGILAQEIREEMIAITSRTGGHLASSLGAVEIILAAHSLLDTPKDKLVFDVGHQAYAHKLVTGRLGDFDTLRSYGGISGFPKPDESPYDVHPSGHASDSLSVATGLAKARVLSGTDEKVVAVIGDAALSGGMAFEALNYMGAEQLPLVVILNDNERSISRNVGALMKHLGYMRTTAEYRDARDSFQELLETKAPLGRAMARFGKNMKESIKQMVIPHSMMFEQLGIVCTAPVDGHDIAALRETLAVCLAADAPVLMHVVTKKGAGYEPAVRDPERFHGVGPFDIETGADMPKKPGAPSYTSVFGDALVREARADERVVAITAAMEGGTGLKPFAAAFPERFVDVGIAEEQAVAMASGLAIGGKKPVVAIYSTFMQRAIDQMAIDCALPDLDVVFALDRAGIVGEDGPTHHGMFDLVYTRMIPNMRVIAPSNEAELAAALHTALALGGPFAIRYPRGSAEGVAVPEEPPVLPVGVSRLLREGDDVAILAFGCMASRALKAARLLAARGIEARVVDMRWVKPMDEEAIRDACDTRLIVTVEAGVIAGGAGEGVCGYLAEMGLDSPVRMLGVPDVFVPQGRADLLSEDLGLDPEGIANAILETLAEQVA